MGLPLPAQAAESSVEYWAVIAGVADYKDFSLEDLPQTENNVKKLSSAFTPAWGKDHILTIQDTEASKSGILEAVAWLAENADADDVILFYFSGHGMKDGCFCAWDYTNYNSGNAVTRQELNNALSKIKTKKMVIILDICYAGSFTTNLKGDSRVLLLGAGRDELGWASIILNTFVYTYYLIEAINTWDKSDTNHDNIISAEEIARYSGVKTPEYEELWGFGAVQHPVLDDGYDGELELLARFAFNFANPFPLGTEVVNLDGESYAFTPPVMHWKPGGSHTMKIPSLVKEGEDTRYIFIEWDDGVKETTRTFSQGKFRPTYRTEFLLNVASEFGVIQGGGWVEKGTKTEFNVTPYVEEDRVKHYFNDWSGLFTGDNATASMHLYRPGTVTANWRHEYLLSINSDFGDTTGTGWYKEGEQAAVMVTPYIEENDSKHYFCGWTGEYTGDGPDITITMDKPYDITAAWRHEYLLTVNSEFGLPTGAGWYKEGENAAIAIAPVQGVIIRKIFTGWNGDYTGTDTQPTVAITNPMILTANWRTDYMQLYMIIGGVVIIGIIVGVVIAVVKRRSSY